MSRIFRNWYPHPSIVRIKKKNDHATVRKFEVYLITMQRKSARREISIGAIGTQLRVTSRFGQTTARLYIKVCQ